VHAIGLHERHRRRDTSEELVIGRVYDVLRGGRSGDLRRRTDWCLGGRLDALHGDCGNSSVRVGGSLLTARCRRRVEHRRRSRVVFVFEELPPGGIDPFGIVAVLLEQLSDVSGVEPG
jgi:hypothetical protein